MTTRTATIIGGGIGGAAVAIGLVRAGWRVSVHERAAHRESSGAALGIWPVALTALDEIGVGDDLRRVGTPQGSGTIRRPDGSLIARISAERLRQRVGDVVHMVARRDLAEILEQALPEGTIRYGEPLRVEEAGGDVVVAADGVFSASRAALFGERYHARYTGQSAFRGRVAVGNAGEEGSETWAPERRFGITPYRDGTTNWYAAITTPAHGRCPGGELAVLREAFGDWHDPIPAVLAAIDESEVMRHDLYDVHPPLPSYVVGRVVLLGDAAHAMTPDLGRGACEALVDAASLARCLRSTVDVPAALASYDRARRRPTQRLQAMSYRLGRLAHAGRLTGLRDLAIRAALRV